MEQRGFVFQQENLLSPSDAIATFLASVPLSPPGIERVALEDAYGRALAQNIAADAAYPNVPRSAMDGFAIRAEDAPGRLRLRGEIAMGRAWSGTLARGEALRIPTGGVVPEPADAVVPIEECRLAGEVLIVDAAVQQGANVTPAGSDMRAGEVVLRANTRINAPAVGVLATLGVTDVPVYRRPVVGIISSGDELVAPAAPALAPGEVRDSNRYAIAGALAAMGAVPLHLPTMRDAPGLLEEALSQALGVCDAVILSGGSSVGERDFTPRAIDSLGKPGVVVHGLRVKPGKPTVFGAIGNKPIVGLPGNPASSLVILEAVAAPIVASLVGAPLPESPIEACLAAPLRSRRNWTWYVPVALRHEVGRWTAHPLPLRSSATSLAARADGYVTMGEDAEAWDAGRQVTVTRFI
jgi:molybdenum cofactor synthesis domain-containing protein